MPIRTVTGVHAHMPAWPAGPAMPVRVAIRTIRIRRRIPVHPRLVTMVARVPDRGPDQRSGRGTIRRAFPAVPAVIVTNHRTRQAPNQRATHRFRPEHLGGSRDNRGTGQQKRRKARDQGFHEEVGWRCSAGWVSVAAPPRLCHSEKLNQTVMIFDFSYLLAGSNMSCIPEQIRQRPTIRTAS